MAVEQQELNASYAGRRFESRLRLKEAQYLQGFPGLDRDSQFAVLERMVGMTPLLRFDQPNGGTVWAKVESANPSECHYDRVALATFSTLEQRGFIKPGDTLIEGTSGSAGRSFALFANLLGYNLQVLVPSEIPEARRRDMKQFGAEVIDVGAGGIQTVVRESAERLLELNRDKSYAKDRLKLTGGKAAYVFRKDGKAICFSNHAESELTPEAFSQIGYEASAQLPVGIAFDTFVGAVGNGSTLKGIAKAIREVNPDAQVIGIENEACPLQYVKKYGTEEFIAEKSRMPTYSTHRLFGTSMPGYDAPFVNLNDLNEISLVSDAEYLSERNAYNARHIEDWQIPDQIGNTSAACKLIAKRRIAEGKAQNVLIVFYDNASQYPDWKPQYPVHDMLDAGKEYVAMREWKTKREATRLTIAANKVLIPNGS